MSPGTATWLRSQMFEALHWWLKISLAARLNTKWNGWRWGTGNTFYIYFPMRLRSGLSPGTATWPRSDDFESE